ncbi:hypothetical protein [Nocardia terpenica]|uniref:Uncharacterized protein n=1 Tax=Nocardia terpenica TaxID=455432 RepID=A0A6G9ZE69_9NOCA|nr:hypothetical protein [Nocardia terpenica]QIS23701.1 hypothetical protein F6W96_40915 [Nocardia terpenica]
MGTVIEADWASLPPWSGGSSTPMWVYLRNVSPRHAEALVAAYETVAQCHGTSVRGRVFRDLGQPAQQLWRVLEAADAGTGATVLARVREAARRQRINLERVLTAPPPTAQLWQLLDAVGAECGRGEPGYVCIPAEAQLDDLGVPREVVLRVFARAAPTLTVVFGDPVQWLQPRDAGLSALDPEQVDGLLADVVVCAGGHPAALVRSHAKEGLRAAELGALVDPVVALVDALVAEAAAADGGEQDFLRIQVAAAAGAHTLSLLVWDRRQRWDDPAPGALLDLLDVDRGGTFKRARSVIDGTVTRCELPLPGAERAGLEGTAALAKSAHRYVRVSGRAS